MEPITPEEREHFTELLVPIRGRLVAFARSITDSEEDAADLVGDTILLALESFRSLRDPQAFLGWLFRIAARRARVKRRRARLFRPYSTTIRPDLIPIEADAPDVAHDIARLYEAIGRLRPKQREAIALYELSGLSIEEVRQIQGGSASAVKMRLKRARARLGELLGANDDATAHERPDSPSTQTIPLGELA